MLAILMLSLTSCSANEIVSEGRRYFREWYAALRADMDEVELEDFFRDSPSIDRAFHLSPDTADGTITGNDSILIAHPHRETFFGEWQDNPPPTAAGYVKTDLLLGISQEEAAEILSSSGVEYTVTEAQNPLAPGRVYAIEYAGVFSDGMHYINPSLPVTLYVSGAKPVSGEGTEGRPVYLTFDDGPGNSTLLLLNILDSYGIKGTFFLLGDGVEKSPEGAEAIYERGHDVACHSMSHVYQSIYASVDNLMKEVDEWVLLMESLGVDFDECPKMFRYPGGSVSQYLTAEKRTDMNTALSERDFLVFDWNVVVNDALLFQCPNGTLPQKYIIDNFLSTYLAAKKEEAPIIILFHDNVPETLSVLPWIIEYLMDDGCTFAPLSDLEISWTFADRESEE